jgi:hypothetical protein
VAPREGTVSLAQQGDCETSFTSFLKRSSLGTFGNIYDMLCDSWQHVMTCCVILGSALSFTSYPLFSLINPFLLFPMYSGARISMLDNRISMINGVNKGLTRVIWFIRL